MNNWQGISDGLEVKIMGKEVWIRSQGQTSDHPHSTMMLNNQGKVINFYFADPRAKISIEGAYYLSNLVSKAIQQFIK